MQVERRLLQKQAHVHPADVQFMLQLPVAHLKAGRQRVHIAASAVRAGRQTAVQPFGQRRAQLSAHVAVPDELGGFDALAVERPQECVRALFLQREDQRGGQESVQQRCGRGSDLGVP